MGNGDFDRGKDDIYKTKDRTDLNYDTHEHRGSFDTGWDLARRASDPSDPTTTRQIVQQVDDDYKPLGPEARKAYRDGYAAGSNRRDQ